MQDFFYNKIQNDYLQQRKENKSSKVILELRGEPEYSIQSLIQVLEQGDCEVYQQVGDLFGDEQEQNEEQSENSKMQENITGQTLTHLTLNAQNQRLSNNQLNSLMCFVDLCPNLIYINLDISQNFITDLKNTDLTMKLLPLKQLRILILNFNYLKFSEISFKKMVEDISQLKALVELDLSIRGIPIKHYNGFYEAFSGNNHLNTLKIDGYNSYDFLEGKYFSISNGYKKISRLVCKQIILNQRFKKGHIDQFEGFGLFD